MSRVKRGVTSHRRHKKILDLTKGHAGQRHRLIKRANESMLHSLRYNWVDRRDRKGDFRGITPLGRWGAITTGSFQVSFYYSLAEGFQIRNELGSMLWLVVPSPAVDMLLKPEVKPPSGKPRKAR